jgi:hypothetical protein
MANGRILIRIGNNDDRIIDALIREIDNIELSSYPTVDEFLAKTEQQQFVWKRLCVSRDFFGSSDEEVKANMEKLNSYVKGKASNTTIVYLVNGQEKENALKDIDDFNSVFHSPMYTPFIAMPGSNIVDITAMVKEDLPILKAAYYTTVLEEQFNKTTVAEKLGFANLGQKIKGVTGSSKGEESETETSSEEVIDESSESPINSGEVDSAWDSDDFENFGESGENSDGSEWSSPESVSEGNSSEKITSWEDLTSESENDVVSEGVSETDGVEDSDDDFNLSGFGNMHADTGFLGEDEEVESLEELQDGNLEHDTDYPIGDVNVTSFEDLNGTLRNSKVEIYVGIRGTGVTSFLVGEALDLVSQGSNVLIVDLDYDTHGVLSYVDLSAFNNREGKIYREDGVNILSVGFGSDERISVKAIIEKISQRFNKVFVDCPIEFVSELEDTLGSCEIFLCCADNIGALMTTQAMLENRKYVPVKVEKHLCRGKGMLFSTGAETDFKEDIIKANRDWSLPYGNWIRNLE